MMNDNWALDVINKWFEFSGFSGERKKNFALDGFTYEIDTGNLRIEKIINQYDSTACIAALYCKKLFDKMLLNKQYSMHAIFNEKSAVVESMRKMYDMFNDDFILEVEKEISSRFEDAFSKMLPVRMIGEKKVGTSKFLDYLEDVIDSLFTMNFDLFLKGGVVGSVDLISTKIFTVPTMAQALLTVESMSDGLWIYYIRGHNMEGYFTYLLKSNGNIMSVNDRIDEAYAGSHRGSRTGKWAEDKKWYLFPYNEMVKFNVAGYKAKDTTTEVVDELNIYELPESSWMPLLLGATLIYMRFRDKAIEHPMKYIDSLQAVNIELSDGTATALIPTTGSQLVSQGQLVFDFSLPSVLSDEYGKEFGTKAVEARLGGRDVYYDKEVGRGWMEVGDFHNLNQYMVDLWADGFAFDPSRLLVAQTRLLSDGSENVDAPFQEVVGTREKMKLQSYYVVRKQLAEYMQKRINDNFEEFGGRKAVDKWFRQACLDNYASILKIVFENSDTRLDMGNWVLDVGIAVCKESSTWAYGNVVYNKTRREPNRRNSQYMTCIVNGKPVGIVFKVQFHNWRGLQQVFGMELPKAIDGYVRHRNHDGNSNISATDLVSQVSTPMELIGSFSYNPNMYYFEVGVGFSVSGFKKFLKNGGELDSTEFIELGGII